MSQNGYISALLTLGLFCCLDKQTPLPLYALICLWIPAVVLPPTGPLYIYCLAATAVIGYLSHFKKEHRFLSNHIIQYNKRFGYLPKEALKDPGVLKLYSNCARLILITMVLTVSVASAVLWYFAFLVLLTPPQMEKLLFVAEFNHYIGAILYILYSELFRWVLSDLMKRNLKIVGIFFNLTLVILREVNIGKTVRDMKWEDASWKELFLVTVPITTYVIVNLFFRGWYRVITR